MMFLKIFVVSVFLFAAGELYPQSLTAVFSNINETQGLSSQGVNCMLEDKRGFVWVGTSNGLNCYDGKTFRIFHHSRFDSSSICDNDIRTLVEDDQGQIWMGTKNGVSCLDPITGKAFNYVKNQTGPAVFSGAFLPLVFSGADKRDIWVCGDGKIAKFDRKKSCFIIDEKLSALIKDAMRIHTISIDSKNNFIVGSDRGLFILDGSEKRVVQHLLPRLTVISTKTDQQGNRWLGTWGDGLVKIDRSGKTISHLFNSKHETSSTASIVGDLQLESEFLWLTSSYGLYKIDTRDTSFPSGTSVIKVVPNEKKADAPSYWGRLMLDQKNELWIGTDMGILVLFKQNQQFRTYPLKGHTTELLFDSEGAWGSSWYGEGLVRYDRDWKIVEKYPKVQPFVVPPNYSQVSAITNLDSSTLLVATFNGLALFNKQTKSFTFYNHKKDNTNSICSDQLTAALVTKSGDIWLGSYRSGLSRTDRSFRKFRHYNVDNSELNTNMIWKLLEDSRGKVWMATNLGICYWDKDSDKLKAVSEFNEHGRQVKIGSLNSILEARNGDMWFCGDGVYRIKKNGEIVYYDVEDGLPTPEIDGLSEDEAGNVWMSSGNGLSCFLATEQKIRNFKMEDGLPVLGLQNIFRNGKRLYATAADLLVAFDPEKLNYRVTVPRTFLLSASFAGKQVTADGFSQTTLRLEHTENDLSVSFSSPLFQGQQNLSHQYKLEVA
jgi:ligand-binding sensor domain-containing protein